MAELGLLVTPGMKGSREVDTLVKRSIYLFYTPEGQIEAIECWEDEGISITFNGCDVHRAQPGHVLKLVSAVAPFDPEDPELGFTYAFPDLSLGLWRADLPSPGEDPGHDARFQTVLVGVPGYYTRH